MSFLPSSPDRIWHLHPASFGLRTLRARLQRMGREQTGLWRILLLSDNANFTSEQQFAPIARHAGALRRHLGVVVQQRAVDDAWRLADLAAGQFDVIGLKLSFRMPEAEAVRVTQQMRAVCDRIGAKLVYFDGDDDLNVQWHGVISLVDLYVKKHLFADPAAYQAQYVGKTNLTDLVARQHGTSFAQDIIPASGGMDPALNAKLHLGWNIALDDKIGELAAGERVALDGPRDVDVSCRAYVPPALWTHPLRAPLVERIEAMASWARVLAPRHRVAQAQYYDEMRRSRICISPFGFGELCWRDFEAVLCGCLLMKPDMSHARTAPDLFQPGVTYVPLRWDFQDLESQCRRYLDDEPARRAMAERARAALLEALGEDWFVSAFAALLERLGQAQPAPAPVAGAASRAVQ